MTSLLFKSAHFHCHQMPFRTLQATFGVRTVNDESLTVRTLLYPKASNVILK